MRQEAFLLPLSFLTDPVPEMCTPCSQALVAFRRSSEGWGCDLVTGPTIICPYDGLANMGLQRSARVNELKVAERVGFEPTVRLPRQRFSRPPDSAALAPLRTLACLLLVLKNYWQRFSRPIDQTASHLSDSCLLCCSRE